MQEEGSLPGMQWRAPQAVCTSPARKIRVPLVARQRQGLSAGLSSLPCAERMDVVALLLLGRTGFNGSKTSVVMGRKLPAVAGSTPGNKYRCAPKEGRMPISLAPMSLFRAEEFTLG